MTDRPSRPWQEQPLRRPAMQQVARREDERPNRERRRVSHPLRYRLARTALIVVGLAVLGLVAYLVVDALTAVGPIGGRP